MKTPQQPDTDLVRLFNAYREMPNGGALLSTLDDGAVSNGYTIVKRFKSRSSACRQLRMAGFLPVGAHQWKIYPAANAMNANRS